MKKLNFNFTLLLTVSP